MLKNFLLILTIITLSLNANVNGTRQTKTSYSVSSRQVVSTAKSQVAQIHYYSVQKVSDGDTATLKNLTDNNTIRVRFLCIDAPEKSQGEWGKMSLKKIGELLPIGSRVTLIGSNRDLYGRTVSEIVNSKNINVNKKMVEHGLAVYYPFQKGCNEYKDLEKVAKSSKLGVWSDPKFEMPWDYRERNCIGARCKNKNKSTTISPSSTHKRNIHLTSDAKTAYKTAQTTTKPKPSTKSQRSSATASSSKQSTTSKYTNRRK